MRVQRAMVWAGSILCAIGSSAIAIIASATGFTPGTAQLTTALPIASVFFGLSVLDYKKTNPLLIFGTTRTWDAYPALDWAEANPAAGQYNFAPLNSYIATNMSRGRQILYTFGRTPRWASTAPDAVGPYGPGQCAPPVISAWDQYVAAIVTNAAGRIKYWELWNEPDQASSYCGDLATMVTMAQHAYRIIKSIDPSAMVLSPAAGGRAGARWLDSYVKAGGLHTFDIVAFHGYEGGQAERIIAIVDAYRLVLSHHHLSAMPLWDTECSWGESNIGDDTHRAAFLSTYFFLQWSKGVDRVLWYAYDGDRKWGRLIDTANNLLPEGVAYGETYKWIVGATMTQLCAQDQNGTWTCSITRPGGYKAQVVWNSIAASSLNFSAPAQMTEYRDLSGGVHPIVGGTVQVQNLPILLETGPGPH
jgi:polysaccharide biosynthesis protein PslG